MFRPTAGETFRSAEGIIPVEVSVESGGSEGLVYRFILDGTVVAEESQPLAQLSGVERGAHGLQVVLLDAGGQQLAASPMVTFYLHQPIAKKKAPR